MPLSDGEFWAEWGLYNVADMSSPCESASLSGPETAGPRPGRVAHWTELHDELDWLPDGGLNIAHEIVDRHANGRRRDKTALTWEGAHGEREEYTFGDLKTLSNRFANVLKSLGIASGDRVCLYIERLPEMYVALAGILKVGAVAMPQPPDVPLETLRDRLRHSSAKVVVTQPVLRRRMGATVYELFDLQHIVVVNKNGRDPLPIDTADLDYDQEMAKAAAGAEVEATSQLDYATVHYTDGPGSEPLGVVHSHQMLVQSVGSGRLMLGLRDDDLYWPTLRPATFDEMSCGILAPWGRGLTIFVSETEPDTERWLETVQAMRVTLSCADQARLRLFSQCEDDLPGQFDLSSLREMTGIGEPLPAEVASRCELLLGVPVRLGWGDPETGGTVLGSLPGAEVRYGSVGRPLPGIEAAVLDGDHIEVDPGVEGVLAIRPGWPSMFRAYWNAPGLYNARFRRGWYVTGHRAGIDRAGYVWLVASGPEQ